MVPLSERAVIAGKYRLERKLEAGGMGSVWVARHLALDEDVAIKFMSHALPEPSEARARFAREARAAAKARGPHVVEVLDHGVDGDVPYLVMELLEGEHLGRRLQREGRLSLPRTATIAEQVARALSRAHRAGIVHRDLKPANVFIARVDDDEEVVKLLDFGIAKQQLADPGDATQGDVLLGSPQYMSPEQARGARDLDHRADLWSLGAILFRAVTGSPAFEGASAVDVLVRICAGPLPVPSHVAPDLPPELDAFFARALDRDPARRFGSAREMVREFAAIAYRTDRSTLRCPASLPAAASAGSGLRRVGGSLPWAQSDAPAPREDEIDAFVERAFSVLASPVARVADDAGAPPPTPRSPGNAADGAPEATVPLLRRLGVVAARTPSIAPREAVAQSGERWLAGEPHARVRGTAAGAPLRGAVGSLIDEGFAALRHGRRDGARRAWRAALELDPSNRTLLVNLRRLEAMGE